jgi:hypothetical protein
MTDAQRQSDSIQPISIFIPVDYLAQYRLDSQGVCSSTYPPPDGPIVQTDVFRDQRLGRTHPLPLQLRRPRL